MVTDQAPRVFAVVNDYGEQVEAEIIAEGMALDESAFVITALQDFTVLARRLTTSAR